MAGASYDGGMVMAYVVYSVVLLITAVLHTISLASPQWLFAKRAESAAFGLRRVELGLITFCTTDDATGGVTCRRYGNFFDDHPHDTWGVAAFFLVVAALLTWSVVIASVVGCTRFHVHQVTKHILAAATGMSFLAVFTFCSALSDASPEKNPQEGFFAPCRNADAFDPGKCTFGAGGISASFGLCLSVLVTVYAYLLRDPKKGSASVLPRA